MVRGRESWGRDVPYWEGKRLLGAWSLAFIRELWASWGLHSPERALRNRVGTASIDSIQVRGEKLSFAVAWGVGP
jgi:hypothetical protein